MISHYYTKSPSTKTCLGFMNGMEIELLTSVGVAEIGELATIVELHYGKCKEICTCNVLVQLHREEIYNVITKQTVRRVYNYAVKDIKRVEKECVEVGKEIPLLC